MGKLCSRDRQAVAITDDLVRVRGPNPLRSGIISPLRRRPLSNVTYSQGSIHQKTKKKPKVINASLRSDCHIKSYFAPTHLLKSSLLD